jgi:carbon monoxide dehydrogenase subunit G
VELTHEFSVRVPIEQAWAALTDLARIAPCMPGAELQEVAGDEYRGVVKVKVGPMTAQYKGVATFRERDAARHRAVVRAEGRDTRGQGNATATVTATLEPADGGTRVRVHTDLAITGKVAQFGRGVLAEVSGKLLGQFVQALEADLLRSAPAAPANTPELRRGEAPQSEPVDLLAAAGWSVTKRAVPLVALAAGLAAALWLLLRR